MEFISVKNVSKDYKKGSEVIHSLNGVSVDIKQGDFTIILGQSGSGKSTLLNLIGGMDCVTSGEIIVDGDKISKKNKNQLTDYRRTDVGYVFQFYNLIPSLNVLENVRLAARLSKSPISAEEAITAVGLKDRMKHFPSEMSGGEMQRVSIARAICKNPKILLCDEPTGALDSVTGEKIWILLHKMATQYKKTVIAVTHNALVAPAADRVIQIKDGKIISVQDNENPVALEKVAW